MKRVRIVSLTAATLAVAVGAGTLFQQETMQQADASPEPAGMSLVRLAQPEPDDAATPSSLTETSETGDTGRQAEGDQANPQPADEPAVTDSAEGTPEATDPVPDARLMQAAAEVRAGNGATGLEADIATDAEAPTEIAAFQTEFDPCSVAVVITPEPDAMLDLSVYAPCDRGARIQISQAPLRFDAVIPDNGELRLDVPALAREAEVRVRFEDGRSKTDRTEVADADLFDRVVLAWRGEASLSLNAYEFGAVFGDAGHVHPGNPSRSGQESHGFLTELGEDERAQIYTFPSGLAARAGDVAIDVEAAITDASCGRPLSAELLELRSGADAMGREIRLEMPDCDGQGGFLVLKNLLPELTLALN
ncbi:MAG: hypothetical protein HLUCCA12_05535 [Rhodobacteraceae bacterium HLUCCA12]|nr:MAG: hypothetical protein HLUCCA12_05535 [Rhodobacteraceae bacterium HLUCCA12]